MTLLEKGDSKLYLVTSFWKVVEVFLVSCDILLPGFCILVLGYSNLKNEWKDLAKSMHPSSKQKKSLHNPLVFSG